MHKIPPIGNYWVIPYNIENLLLLYLMFVGGICMDTDLFTELLFKHLQYVQFKLRNSVINQNVSSLSLSSETFSDKFYCCLLFHRIDFFIVSMFL